MGDKRVYIMDVYNRHIYPGDSFAKRKPGLLGVWGPLSRGEGAQCGRGAGVRALTLHV